MLDQIGTMDWVVKVGRWSNYPVPWGKGVPATPLALDLVVSLADKMCVELGREICHSWELGIAVSPLLPPIRDESEVRFDHTVVEVRTGLQAAE